MNRNIFVRFTDSSVGVKKMKVKLRKSVMVHKAGKFRRIGYVCCLVVTTLCRFKCVVAEVYAP